MPMVSFEKEIVVAMIFLSKLLAERWKEFEFSKKFCLNLKASEFIIFQREPLL